LGLHCIGAVKGDGRAGCRPAVEGEVNPEIPLFQSKLPLPGRGEGILPVPKAIGELRTPQQAVFEVVEAEVFPTEFNPFFAKKAHSVFSVKIGVFGQQHL